ncbi:hypothetical protein V6N11_007855 [Hibiscus sabdariffa]|uniref:Uncharacterized protein n=1 Tax=Hibiscus sabdariffa TaxID=183260 RepID=A0ABR2PYV6_9ROSI
MNSPKTQETSAANSLVGIDAKDKMDVEENLDPTISKLSSDSMIIDINSNAGFNGEPKVEFSSKPSFRDMVMGKDSVVDLTSEYGHLEDRYSLKSDNSMDPQAMDVSTIVSEEPGDRYGPWMQVPTRRLRKNVTGKEVSRGSADGQSRVLGGNKFDALRINEKDAWAVTKLIRKAHGGSTAVKLAANPKESLVRNGDIHSEIAVEKADGHTGSVWAVVKPQAIDVASADIFIPMPVTLNLSANKAIRIVEAVELSDTLTPAMGLDVSGGEGALSDQMCKVVCLRLRELLGSPLIRSVEDQLESRPTKNREQIAAKGDTKKEVLLWDNEAFRDDGSL